MRSCVGLPFRRVAALLACSCACLIVAAQLGVARLTVVALEPAGGTQSVSPATLRGRVTATDASPLPRVEVSLTEPGAPPSFVAGFYRQTFTDADGRFSIDDIAPGRYILSVSKPGYVARADDRTTSMTISTTIEFRSGEVHDLDFVLLKGGVIAGVLVDEAGEPLGGATVSAARGRFRDGQESYGVTRAVTTDDLGRFRIWGLRPGRYRVWGATTSSAVPGGGNRLGYLPTYYPGTPYPGDATAVVVGAEAHVQGVSIPMRPGRTGSISGSVRTLDAALVANVLVGLTPIEPSGLAAATGRTVMSRNGDFSFDGVAQGDYRLTAIAGRNMGIANVRFDGDTLADITLTLSSGQTLRGHIVFLGQGAAPDPQQVEVRLISLDRLPVGEPPVVAPDGTFEAQGIHAPRVLIRARAPGWMLDGIFAGRVDVTDAPLDLDSREAGAVEIFLRPESTVSGTVVDSRGQASPNATVVIFAGDPAKWTPGTRFIARTRSEAEGRYEFRGLPPSQYVVVAVRGLEAGEEANPDLLAAWRLTGTSLNVGTGASHVVHIRGAF